MVMTLAGSILASKGAHLYFGTIYPASEPIAAPVARNGHGVSPAVCGSGPGGEAVVLKWAVETAAASSQRHPNKTPASAGSESEPPKGGFVLLLPRLQSPG